MAGGLAVGTRALQPVHGMDLPQEPADRSLMGHRFVTLCIMIRTTPWEVSRDVKLLPEDESKHHTLKVVRDLRQAFARDNPDGRLTWGFTLNALEDKRPNYQDIRKYAAECQQKHGDEVTYFPGYFPALYLPRQRVNREASEALQIISSFVGAGYRPKSIMAVSFRPIICATWPKRRTSTPLMV